MLVQVEGLAVPVHQVGQGMVFDHHTLGLAGRARGVDEVGQLPIIQTRDYRVVRRGVGMGLVQVHARHARGQALDAGLGQHPGGCAVGQQVGNAVCGVSGIDRHVGRTGLEHREHADQPVGIARQAQGDALAWLHTFCQQPVGQLIGLLVEHGVAQCLAVLTQRDGVWRHARTRFDPCVHGVALAISAGGVVEATHHLIEFLRWQHGHVQQGRVGRLFQGVHEIGEHLLELLAQACGIPLRQALHGQAQVIAQVVDAHRQRVIGTLFGTDNVDARRHRNDLGGIAGVAVTVIEHAVEQGRGRRHTAAALGQGQGRLLVGQQAGQATVGVQQAVLDPHLCQVDTQRQRVDEHSQGLLSTLPGGHAAQQYAAEHHCLTPGQLPHPTGEAQVQDTGWADPLLPGLLAQAPSQGCRQGQPGLLQALLGACLGAEGQGRLVDIGQHVLEELGMGLFVQGLARRRQEVAERRRRGQLGGSTGQVRLNFPAYDIQRRVIHDHVMEGQQRHPRLPFTLGMGQVHQGRLAQVQSIPAWGEALAQLGQCVMALERQRFTHQGRFAPHHLHGLVQVFPMHGSAQDVMALDDRLQGIGEGIEVRLAGQAQLHLRQVGVAVLGREVVVQHALLQGCQRVDVLYVGGAARHAVDDTVDGHLVKADQWQHVRGDPKCWAEPIVILTCKHLQQSRLVPGQRLPQRVVQRLIVTQDNQVLIFTLQTDGTGGKCVDQFAEVHR